MCILHHNVKVGIKSSRSASEHVSFVHVTIYPCCNSILEQTHVSIQCMAKLYICCYVRTCNCFLTFMSPFLKFIHSRGIYYLWADENLAFAVVKIWYWADLATFGYYSVVSVDFSHSHFKRDAFQGTYFWKPYIFMVISTLNDTICDEIVYIHIIICMYCITLWSIIIFVRQNF